MVVLYGGACVLQAGIAATKMDGRAAPVNASEFIGGALYKGIQKSGRREWWNLFNVLKLPHGYQVLSSLQQTLVIDEWKAFTD